MTVIFCCLLPFPFPIAEDCIYMSKYGFISPLCFLLNVSVELVLDSSVCLKSSFNEKFKSETFKRFDEAPFLVSRHQSVSRLTVSPLFMMTAQCFCFHSDVTFFSLFQVSDTLKKFAVKVTSSSIKERKEIYGELRQCLKGKGKKSHFHYGLLCNV